MLFENVLKNIIKILSISFLKLSGGVGGGVDSENNHAGSSISDQCYFYAKYSTNASTRACFYKFLGEQNNRSKSAARCVAIAINFF